MSSTNNIFTAGVVRFIALLVFAFGIIWLFKNDISRTMEGGCFSLSVDYADTGFNLSDQKYCTSEDIEDLAGSMVELGATNVESEADKVFLAYEKQIEELVLKNNELAVQVNRQNEIGEEIVGNKQSFSRYLMRMKEVSGNSQVVVDIQNNYNRFFGIIPETVVNKEKIAIINPTEMNKSTTLIRSNFTLKAQKTTKEINSTLKVKR